MCTRARGTRAKRHDVQWTDGRRAECWENSVYMRNRRILHTHNKWREEQKRRGRTNGAAAQSWCDDDYVCILRITHRTRGRGKKKRTEVKGKRGGGITFLLYSVTHKRARTHVVFYRATAAQSQHTHTQPLLCPADVAKPFLIIPRRPTLYIRATIYRGGWRWPIPFPSSSRPHNDPVNPFFHLANAIIIIILHPHRARHARVARARTNATAAADPCTHIIIPLPCSRW